jgi:hypothetical protein
MSLFRVLEGVASLLTLSANPTQRSGDSANIYIEKKEKDKPLFNNWVSFPWKNINAVNRLKKSEFGRQMITEILFLGRKLKKVNMMAEFPGVPALPGFSKTPERQWAPTPVSEENWTQGKHALRLEFLDSPRTTLVIGNPSNRTIRVGNQRQVQCGGYASYINLTQDYRALEESQEFHMGHRVKHFRGLKPLELKKASEKWNNPKDLVDAALAEPLTQKPDSKILFDVVGEGIRYKDEIGKRKLAYHLDSTPGSKLPEQDSRDEVRDTNKFRGQEWNRYETVYRVEAVGIDFEKVLNEKTGKLESSQDARYEGEGNMAGAPNQTPVLSPDSPQALFEVRAKDFSTIAYKGSPNAPTASIICATPAFVLCGMTNPNDKGDVEQFYSESSAFKWSKGGKETADGDNFFAVRDKKNLTKNWNDILPLSLSEDSVPELPIADYGIFGSGAISHNEKKLAGLELFGREGLLLGAGKKNTTKNMWSTGLFLGKDHIKLSKASKNGGCAESSILIDELKLSIESRNQHADKYASLDMNPKIIDLTVTDEMGITGVRIENNQVTVWVKGKKIYTFDDKGAREPAGTIQYRV